MTKARVNPKCKTCAKLKHSLCDSPNNLLCDDWVDFRASCPKCSYVESCITLGKNVGNLVYCLSYDKGDTIYPRKEFDDYEEYIQQRKEKEELKIKNKAKLDKKLKKIKDTDEVVIPRVPVKKNQAKVKKEIIPTDTYENTTDKSIWSPLSIIDNIIASDYDPQAFSLVDERDMPKSHNIISFITEPKFLGQPLYPRQYQILLDFFAAYCPHCSDTKFIRKGIRVDEDIQNIKDKTVLYRDGVCPKCSSRRNQDVKDKYHTIYTTMGLAIGQRAGKTSTAWFTSPAIIHEYLQMPNPVKFMKQLSVTEFHSTFVGITYEEAFRTIWSPMQRVFATSNWFQLYHQLLDEESRRLGIELYKVSDSFVLYKHKGIMAYPSGPDYRKLRGKTRIVGAMDEAAYLMGSGILMNATQVYDALDNSFSTLRAASEQLFKTHPGVPSAYGLYLSSTRTRLDFIVSLVKKSKSIDHIYGRKMATWEFNPNITRESAFIKGKYAEDPVAAERDFASNPPFASDPFIKSPASIVNLVSKKKNTVFIERYKKTEDSLGSKAIYPMIGLQNIHTFPSILALDAGYSNNSYAMAIMHYLPLKKKAEETDEGEIDERKVIGISGLLEIKPEAYPLSFPRIYKYVISKILNNFNIVMVAVDRWQSIDLRQRIFEDFRIDCVQYSLKYQDFEEHRKRVFSETIVLPKLDGELNELLKLDKDLTVLTKEKPVSHLLLQYLTSMDTGRMVVKGEGDGLTDDLLRAVALGSTIIDHPDFTALFEADNYKEEVKRNNQCVGAMTGFSGGASIMSVPGIGSKISF